MPKESAPVLSVPNPSELNLGAISSVDYHVCRGQGIDYPLRELLKPTHMSISKCSYPHDRLPYVNQIDADILN
jgi:hypothetical protein